MTDFVALNETTQLGVDRIATSPVALALYRNLLAVAEGTAGAPRIIGLWKQLAYAAPASAAAVQFTSSVLGSDYDEHLVIGINLVPATNNVDMVLNMSINDGSSYDSGGSSYAVVRSVIGANTTDYSAASTGTTNIGFAGAGNGISNTANLGGMNFQCYLHKLRSTNQVKHVIQQGSYAGTAAYATMQGSGFGIGTANALRDAAVNAINFQMSSGNIASGEFYLFGRARVSP
jgi:hypothetical protein